MSANVTAAQRKVLQWLLNRDDATGVVSFHKDRVALEQAGLIQYVRTNEEGLMYYRLTPAGGAEAEASHD